MLKIKKNILIYFLIILASISFTLSLDFFFGKNFVPDEKDNARIYHEIFGFTLKPNIIKNYSFLNSDPPSKKIKFCTDPNGFRISCEKKNIKFSELKSDVIIIGDSISEATAVHYEETFAGLVEKALDQNVLNLAVNGYDFTNYYTKLHYYLNRGLETKRLVLTITTVNDWLQYDNEHKLDLNDPAIPKSIINKVYFENKSIKNNLRKIFPMTYQSLWKIKNILFPPKNRNVVENNLKSLKKINFSNFNFDQPAFFALDKINDLVKEKKIQLYIVIFPLPGNFFIDNQKYVSTMKKYCEIKNCKIINLFETFFNDYRINTNKNLYKNFFLVNDDHFNVQGHKLIAEEIIKKLNN